MRRAPVAPGQIEAFFPEEVPETFLSPGTERAVVKERAGTHLARPWSHEIRGRGKRGDLVHGLYDESQRVYQTGGEMSKFIYWKTRSVTIAKAAWEQVWQKADWIEVIDHERNVCWRIAMAKAIKNATVYDAGVGPRVAIPMEAWDVIRADGTYQQKGQV